MECLKMYLEISNRRTGKTKRFINAIIGKMSKNPDCIFFVYCLNKFSLPNCIRNNKRVIINPSTLRGLKTQKSFLFVDDLECNRFFEKIYQQEFVFSNYKNLMENSYITVSKENEKQIVKDFLKFNNEIFYEHKWWKI